MRTAELTLPGFRHDVCSAIHPGAVGSPFLRSLPLEEHGLEWIHPPAPLAHPFDDGTAAVLESSVAETAAGLGEDGAAYRHLFEPLVEVADDLTDLLLAPLRRPRHLRAATRFAASALLPATMLARRRFAGERARALFGGLAAHSILPLSRPPSGAVGLALGLFGHAFGWPLPRGGSQAIADALARTCVRSAPRSAAAAGSSRSRNCAARASSCWTSRPASSSPSPATRCPPLYRRRLAGYRYGPGAFKLDFALDGSIPWAADELRSGGDRPPRRNAGRDRRCRGPGRGGGSIRSARSSCSPSKACSTPLARPERQAHRLGVLPRPERVDRRHGRPRSRRRSSASPPVSASGSSPVTRSAGRARALQRQLRRRRHRRRRSRTCGSCSPGRPPGSSRTRPPSEASTSARLPRRPAPACTACAASTPPGPRFEAGDRGGRPPGPGWTGPSECRLPPSL